MYDFCVTYPWAIMVAGSGVAGFVLKRSIPSLASGLVLGALLSCSQIRVYNNGKKIDKLGYTRSCHFV